MVRGVLAVVLGLMLAVLVAAAAGAISGLPLLEAAAGFEPLLARLANAACPILLFTFPFALAAIAAAEARRWRSWGYWGLVGAVIGICGYWAYRNMGAAVAPAMIAGRAPVSFAVMGLLGGLAYWWVAGRKAGSLSAAFQSFFSPGQSSDKGERRRCAWCAALGLLLGLVPLALLGWHAFHKSNPPIVKVISAKAEEDAARMLKDGGVPSLKFTIDERPHYEHIGHVSGSVANYAAKIDAYKRAKTILAPMVGMPGVVAVLQDDILAADESDPQVAAENARIRAAQDAADSLAKEAAAMRKAEQERIASEAKRKADEEAAAAKKKAEDEARLAAEAEAKRKADEEAAAAKKKAEDEARLAAEAEAKRKADVEAAVRKPAQQQSVPAESNWTPSNGMDVDTITRVNCVGEFGQLFASDAIRFTMKSAALESQHAPFLDKISNLAKRCDGIGLLIEGNADAWGAEEFNQALSEQRAEAVRAALVERGVTSKQLATRGFGELKPLVRERSREADLANRRVDFGVIEIEKIPQTIQPKDAGPSKN
jgi:outer membrane protein OmpA-like peptidoglycan-associated protein